MSRCLSVDELADFLAGDESRAPHVLQCPRCRSLLEVLQAATTVLDLDAAVAEIEQRQGEAAEAVSALEAALPHRWTEMARGDRRLHGPEGVRQLLARAAASFGTMPRRAHGLAQAALLCCDLGDVPPAVRFDALKDFARYSVQAADDLQSAIAALDSAEKLVPETADPSHFAAILQYARACVWGDATCGRWDDALRSLDLCDEVLKQTDAARWRGARHLRAVTLVRRGNYKDAAALFEELLKLAPDEYGRVLLGADLADCYGRMGRPREALVLLDEAEPVFLARSETLRWARALWLRGDALAALGEHDESIRALTVAARSFAAAGLNDDELGVELSLLRVMRLKNESKELVARLEQAYLVATALDAEQPFRSGVRRAALWAELCAAYRDGELTPTTFDRAAERWRREVEARHRSDRRVN